MSIRLPPDYYERSLLGGLLLFQEDFPRVEKLITADDFSDKDNAALYRAMLALHAAAELPECENLTDLDTLDVEVPAAFPDLTFYARKIADAALRRRLIKAATEIAALGNSWHGSTAEFSAEADRRLQAARVAA